MKEYGIMIRAKDALNSYNTIKTLIKQYSGEIKEYVIVSKHKYIVKVKINSKTYKLITKLTLRSNNIQKVYIVQIP